MRGVTVPPVSERELLEALRRGDEQAFTALVDGYGASMLRMARVYVHDRAVAEEVVQEAWVGVLRGIERFEGRSSQLRSPPTSSGSEVVAAAAAAPDGAWTSSLSASALRMTGSPQGPP